MIAPMNTRRSRTAVATVGNLLYAIGGFDSTNDLASAECFNVTSNQVRNAVWINDLILTWQLAISVDRDKPDGH